MNAPTDVKSGGWVMARQKMCELDEMFDLLTHPHRRYVLYYLRQDGEGVGLETLAAAIANWDGDSSGGDQSDNREAIEVMLRHTHLPKLADAGIITFDANTASIELDGTIRHGQFIAEASRIEGYTHPVAGD